MSNTSFTCPYCGRPTTVTDPNQFMNWTHLDMNNSNKGEIGLGIYAITCPNDKCRQLSLKVFLAKAKWMLGAGEWKMENILQQWQLLPESEAKVIPVYVPEVIKADYYEACRIRDLSPKASATLARRCLQGMIRDFWKITKSRLKDEIDALEAEIDPIVWQGIDAVRSVGNIGAHMEKDINTIVDVEPKEAQLLIGLVERLIDDWYVNRKNKEDHLEQLKEMAEGKKKPKEETTTQ